MAIITAQGGVFSFGSLDLKAENFKYGGSKKELVKASSLSDAVLKKLIGGLTDPGTFSASLLYDGSFVPSMSTASDTLNIKLSNGQILQASALLNSWGFSAKDSTSVITADFGWELTSKLVKPTGTPTVTASATTPITAHGTTFTFAGFTYSLQSISYSGCKSDIVTANVLSEDLVQKIAGTQGEAGTLTVGFFYDGAAVITESDTEVTGTVTFSNDNAISASMALKEWNFDDPSGASPVSGTAVFDLTTLFGVVE